MIEYLAYSNELVQESEKEWQKKFIALKGYEKLYGYIQKIDLSSKEMQEEEEIDIQK